MNKEENSSDLLEPELKHVFIPSILVLCSQQEIRFLDECGKKLRKAIS